MTIWNKILIGLIFLMSLVFMYMAARTLKGHELWRSKAQSFERALENVEQQIDEAQHARSEGGVIAEMGIDQLRLELYKLLVDRGRAWYDTQPEQINAETGAARVNVPFPSEDNLPGRHGIAENTVLYAFEQAPVEAPLGEGGGRYLGEFKVTEVAEGLIGMEPAQRMSQRELDRLASSAGPWSLYEVMPIDGHDVLAEMDDQYLRTVLPESVAAQYVRDREPATPEQIEELGLPGQVVDAEGQPVGPGETGVYLRPLRDYEVLFRDYHRQAAEWGAEMAAALSDQQYAEAAREDAQRQLAFRQAQISQRENELATETRQRDIVQRHRQALERKLAEIARAAGQILADNRTLASQIAQIQLTAQRRIDERTRRMARTEAAR